MQTKKKCKNFSFRFLFNNISFRFQNKFSILFVHYSNKFYICMEQIL